jgi:hypothetical protein
MADRDNLQDARKTVRIGRRNLIGGMVLGTAAASATVAAGPTAALEKASREPTHQNILDHLDDII